jgi:hypothetical protein
MRKFLLTIRLSGLIHPLLELALVLGLVVVPL